MARYLVTYLPGNPISTRTKYVDDASGPPDADVDFATDGVLPGSVWIDTTNHRAYIAESVGTGIAEWIEISGGGASELSSLLRDLSVTGANDVDRDAAATHDLTLTGNSTLTPIHSDPPTGDAIDLRILIRQDGTGGWTLAWGGTIDWAGGSAPTMPTAANALLTVGLLSVDDGATWLGYAGTNEVTQAEFDAHLADAADAHDASAVSLLDTGGNTTETNVEGAIAELYGLVGMGGSGHYELLMTGASPPEPLEDGTGTDWLYVWVT